MSTMVVQAHPLEDCFNTALLASVCAGLEADGDEAMVRRIGENQRPTAEEMSGTSRLVLVYPTWGGGQPAMLLDWLHAMLTNSGFGTVEHLQVATTHGSSRLVNKMQGEWGRRFLAERVVSRCRVGTRLGWHALYKVDRLSSDEMSAFLTETERYFSVAPSPAR